MPRTPIHRRRATLLVRVPGGDAKHEPALDVAPGIPRRPRKPLGFAGPLVGRLARGTLGLGPHGPPFGPKLGRQPRQPQAPDPIKSAHPWGFRHVHPLGCFRWDSPGHVPSPGGRVHPGHRLRRARALRDCQRLASSRAGGGPLLGPHGPSRSHFAENSLGFREALRLYDTAVPRVTCDHRSARVTLRGRRTLALWVTLRSSGVSWPSRPGGMGVQRDHVTGEACPRGSGPGARRVLREGVHLPPRQGPSSQGIRFGLSGGLVCRGCRAPLNPQVAKLDVVGATSHTKPLAIVLRGIVPDDLVAALTLPLPPGLDRPIPFEPRAAG